MIDSKHGSAFPNTSYSRHAESVITRIFFQTPGARKITLQVNETSREYLVHRLPLLCKSIENRNSAVLRLNALIGSRLIVLISFGVKNHNTHTSFQFSFARSAAQHYLSVAENQIPINDLIVLKIISYTSAW